MFGALLVVMDALEHSDLTPTGKCAVLEAAAGRGNETIFESAEPFLRLKRVLQHLRLSMLQQQVVLRLAGRWIGGEWPPFSSVVRAAAYSTGIAQLGSRMNKRNVPGLGQIVAEDQRLPLHEKGKKRAKSIFEPFSPKIEDSK